MHKISRKLLFFFAFSYSFKNKEWGLLMVDGRTPQEFICEVRSNRLSTVLLDSEEDRDYEYGIWVQDPKYLPRGPKIIHQPESAMFDLLKRDVIDHVSITCLGELKIISKIFLSYFILIYYIL